MDIGNVGFLTASAPKADSAGSELRQNLARSRIVSSGQLISPRLMDRPIRLVDPEFSS